MSQDSASSEKYSPADIENHWAQEWENTKLYRSEVDWERPKHYALTMLPYPSGDLHIGHWYAMTPSDTRARYMRMKGFNVLFPMGFDAFGLPAENAAVNRNIHPAKWTYANMERMRKQLRSMGAMFDWEREAVSCDPTYYKWTEWFFKQFYENDLAYRGEAMVNWSPTLQTVLANEQVIDGKDERTGQPVIQKMMTQWFFRYRRYADEMLDFSKIDWPEPVKIMQTNWIGRSEGAHVTFHAESGDPIEVYTTRPDTLWGATFMVLAPEHDLVAQITTDDQKDAVKTYVDQAKRSTEIERTAEGREKTGVFTGAYAINPVNQAKVPIWIADYVMVTYGSGAIMAVPAHDQRDFDFARQFDLSIVPVIQPDDMDNTLTVDTMDEAYIGSGTMINSEQFNGTEVTTAKGRKNPSINAVIDYLEAEGIGKEAVNYRLRDWLISRQRYWGCPIPIVFDEEQNTESVPDAKLPITLPEDVEFKPSGQSPLITHDAFLNTTTHDGKPARRETDTMDTFMCSSLYHLRYLSPHYDDAPFDPEEAAYWLPVDVYTGGAEHATMHLLYTRWFNKAIRDLGVFDDALKIMEDKGRDTDSVFDEPMLLLRNQGQVLGAERRGHVILASGRFEGDKLFADNIQVINPADTPDSFDGVMGEIMRRTENILQVSTDEGILTTVEVVENATIDIPEINGENTVNQLLHHLEIQRMSKSKGNVVNPDELVAKYGADTVRAYLMFAFNWEKGGPWNEDDVQGVVRWLRDVWDIVYKGAPDGEGDEKANRDIVRKLHNTIERVDDSLSSFSFNTSVAALMEFRNHLKTASNNGKINADTWHRVVMDMLKLMAPITPFIAEELWAYLGGGYSIHQQDFPVYDAELAKDDEITLIVQVNGKLRDTLQAPADISEEDAKAMALASEAVQKFLEGEPRKIIYVSRNHLINIVK